MSEWDAPKVDLDHPDSAIRLASAVHRFKVPKMNEDRKLSFARRKVSNNKKDNAQDDCRNKLMDALSAGRVSHERVVADARRYQPLIHQILVSCKFQPEMARLDERLIFEWISGIESKPKGYRSEAMMYEMVMSVVCEGLGKAGVATETSVAGEFAAASREYAAAAGIFQFLAEDHLPKWVSRAAKTDGSDLPVECSIQTAEALTTLFKANGQQMAIATVLIKPGTPNYSLLAKLCLGVQEQLEHFISHMRENAFKEMARIEKDFFTLTTFQIQLQKSLSLYFHARALWDETGYGLAIALLSEATVELRTRASDTAKGVPDVAQIPTLRGLNKDLKDLRAHMALLLQTWEKDNSSVYFEKVPQKVPADKKLAKGVQIGKAEKYSLADPEPLLLSLEEDDLKRSDSDLARELQERLNSGLDE